MIVVNTDRIPSSSHNATGEDEHGMFWPARTRFQRLNAKREKWWQKKHPEYSQHIFLEQIGGEEVIVAIPESFFAQHFAIEAVKPFCATERPPQCVRHVG